MPHTGGAAAREPLLPGGGGGVGVGIGGSGDAADATLPPLLPSALSLNAPPAAAPLSLRAALYDAAVREEMAALFALALPTGLGIMARQLVPVVDAAVLGRLGTPFLAAASVAQIFTVATFGFVWQSVGSALNTLAAQADGAGERALVGLWLQTALAVAAVACALVSLIWAFGAAASLRLLGFDAGVSELAQLFVRWYLLFMWPNMAYIAVTNYLNSFSVSWPPLVANVALLCVNVVMNVLLVLGTAPFGSAAWAGIGFVGSPIASGATQAGVVALLVLFVRASPALHEGLWPGWRPREALAWPRVRTFMRQALPGFAAFFLQDAYLQLASLLAAELGPAEVAAHSALLQLLFALTCLIYGLTKATQVRVAALLGRGDARLARLVALLATAVCTAVSAAVGLALVAARDVAGSLFSSDPAVIAAAREIALPCGLSYTLSECVSFFYCGRALLAAQARPGPITLAFLVGAWGVGAPLAFAQRRWMPELGLAGIWYTLVVGFTTVTLISWFFVLRSDWPALAAKAGVRARSSAVAVAVAEAGPEQAGETEKALSKS